MSQKNLRRGLTGCLLLILIVGTSGVGVAHPASSSPGMDSMLATSFEGPSGDFGQRTIPSDPVAQVEQVEAEDEEGEGDEPHHPCRQA
ncbi:MAG: hypothetical protein ABEI52_04435, partial [Halobacteriaceae archaeon]